MTENKTLSRKKQSEIIKQVIKSLNTSISKMKLLDMKELVLKGIKITPIYTNMFLYQSYNIACYVSKSIDDVRDKMNIVGKDYYLIKIPSESIYVGITSSSVFDFVVAMNKHRVPNQYIDYIYKHETPF